MDYQTLRSRVESALGRSDVPDYVYAMATADINRDVRVAEMETTATLSASSETVALPSDFASVRSIYIDRTPRRMLMPITSQSMSENHDSSGLPAYYAVENGQLRLMPAPDGTYSVVLRYYAKMADLTSDGDTNAVMAEYPGLYVYSAAGHAAIWAQDQEMARLYGDMYIGEVGRVEQYERKRQNPGPMTRRPAVTGF